MLKAVEDSESLFVTAQNAGKRNNVLFFITPL